MEKVKIKNRQISCSSRPKMYISSDLIEMAHQTQIMLKNSLDALINHDSELAHQVCASDDIVDNMNRQMYLKVQDAISKNPEQILSLIHLLSASRHLERIADHTTNIVEDVIYMIEGQIVRHKTEDYNK